VLSPALREIGDLQAVDAMTAALQDPHGGVRWHRGETLERCGWQPRNEEERCCERLRSH